MKKKAAWVKSLAVTAGVTALMAAAGLFFLGGNTETPSTVTTTTAGKIETTGYSATVNYEAENNLPATDAPAIAAETSAPAADNTDMNQVPQAETLVAVTTSVPVVEQTAVEEKSEAPAVQPQQSTAPVSYSFGSSKNYTFRMEVKVTNKGSETSNNITVSVPLLENSSPYQSTSLKSVNYDIVSTSGRVATFNIGDLAPGESKTITADFTIGAKTVSLNSSNATVELARSIYQKHAGSGNCRDLALAFINEARANGIQAREVIGFARTQRGAMTSGSLQGTRHSWAEFYVDGLGWVPVDLTFHYFGAFPHTSHIVESYSDQSIKVNYSGGSLGASWSNSIL